MLINLQIILIAKLNTHKVEFKSKNCPDNNEIGDVGMCKSISFHFFYKV